MLPLVQEWRSPSAEAKAKPAKAGGGENESRIHVVYDRRGVYPLYKVTYEGDFGTAIKRGRRGAPGGWG